MNRNLIITNIVATVATLGLSSQAWAACNLDGSVTGAASVYDQSGQGNFSCSDLNFDFDITDLATITLSPDGDSVQEVSISQPWTSSNQIRAVVVKPSNGDRCVYNYPTVTYQAFELTPDSNKPVSEVLVCSDGVPGIKVSQDVEPTLPVTTTADSCTGDIKVDGSSIFSDTTAEVAIIAETIDGQTVASCSLTADGQEYCEDRCVNFRDVGETPACLTSVNGLTGEFNLTACAPCDTAKDVIAYNDTQAVIDDPTLAIPEPVHPVSGAPMEFCWEKINSVCETGDLAGCAAGRNPGTMLKHTPVRQSDTSITWYNKCRKSTITLNGIDYTTTTCR